MDCIPEIILQARSESALSSRDSSVSSLKNCWDILKCENKTFLTLVTSAFPCAKVSCSVWFIYSLIALPSMEGILRNWFIHETAYQMDVKTVYIFQ
jgi:hypothetical protein